MPCCTPAGSSRVGKPSAHRCGSEPDVLRSRHVLTNIFIDPVDSDHARGISYLSLYRHVGEESLAAEPIPFDGPAAVGHYEDRFVRTGDGWRFERRVLHLAFRRARRDRG